MGHAYVGYERERIFDMQRSTNIRPCNAVRTDTDIEEYLYHQLEEKVAKKSV